MGRKGIADEDVLFKEGFRSTHMFWLVSGTSEYEHQAKRSPVETGDWLCEATLWVAWVTRGTAQAGSDTAVITVDTGMFGKAICGDEVLLGLCGNYAANFVEWLN